MEWEVGQNRTMSLGTKLEQVGKNMVDMVLMKAVNKRYQVGLITVMFNCHK